MKKSLLLLVPFLFVIAVQSQSQDLSGREIIEIHRDRHLVKSARDTIVMLLIDKKGQQKKRVMNRYGKQFDDGLNRTLITFVEPADIRGTALLTWELSEGRNKQWLYLPDQKSMRLVASSAKKSPFMGSDFIYEDLQPDNIDNYTYSNPVTETIDDRECYVIEMEPADKENARSSSYGKRVLWIRKDIFFALKIEFYDHRGRMIKTQTNHDLVNLEGDIWFAEKVIMEDHQKEHQTLMGVQSRELNAVLDDQIFTEKYILSGRHIY